MALCAACQVTAKAGQPGSCLLDDLGVTFSTPTSVSPFSVSFPFPSVLSFFLLLSFCPLSLSSKGCQICTRYCDKKTEGQAPLLFLHTDHGQLGGTGEAVNIAPDVEGMGWRRALELKFDT